MTAIRGSLPELVARLEALDAQREALAAVVAERLGLGGTPRRTQATQPQAPAKVRGEPGPQSGRASPGVRAKQVMALFGKDAKRTLTLTEAAAGLGVQANLINKTLSRLVMDGVLRRMGPGVYERAVGKAKAKAAKAAAKGQRETEVLALAADLAKREESLTTGDVVTNTGISAENAMVLLSRLTRRGKLQRVSAGIYMLPTGGGGGGEARPDTQRAKIVALAESNGGVVSVAEVMAAGICDDRDNALTTLRKLHGQGRLERVAPFTYATPDKAAQMRALKKSERAAQKNAEQTP